MFKSFIVVPMPKEHNQIISDLCSKIGHFGERHIVAKMNKRYFWHNKMKDVIIVVCACKQCQLVKRINNIKSNVEDLNNISICNKFYKIALDIAGPLLEINNGNWYI